MLNISERSGSFYGAAVGSAALGAVSDLIPIFWLAEGYHRRAVALAEQIQDSDALGTTYICLMMHKCCVGEWDATVEYSRKAAETHQKTGDLHALGMATVFLAHTSNYRGNFAEALVHCRDLVRFGQEGALPEVQCWGLGQQGFCQRHMGEVDEAITTLREAVALAKAIPDYGIHVLAGGELGRCYLCQGQLEQALSTLQANQQVYVEHRVGWGTNSALFNGLAEAYLLVAEQSDSTARADRLQKAKYACRAALKQGKAFRGGLPEAMMLQGRYAWLRGKPATAKKWWQRSLTLAGEMGQRYDLGLTHLEMGQRLGERAHLERAEAIFAEIGAEWELARVREASGELQAV
jgi:tetratricopeptide (TPR) repeat protein